METSSNTIDALLHEDRRFPPTAEFARQAHVSSADVYREAEQDPENFWARWADELHWFRPWNRVLDWDPPYAKWFQIYCFITIDYNRNSL